MADLFLSQELSSLWRFLSKQATPPPPHLEVTAFCRWDVGASGWSETPFEIQTEAMPMKQALYRRGPPCRRAVWAPVGVALSM